jgi:Mg2+ and Co2+ transporter CorA
MTSRRRLKKEIDYMVSDLVLDCFTYISLYQKPNNEETLQVVQNTLALRNELREKANHPERKDKVETIKSYYDNIAKTLIDSVEESYGKLGKLAEK